MTGPQWHVSEDLAGGTWFWSVRDTTTGVATPVWQFRVESSTGAVDSAWGTSADFDGDGICEIVVGQPLLDEVDVFSISGGTTRTIATLHGASDSHFGCSVSAASDVNGDGFGDLVVGAYWGGGIADGAVSLFLGGPDGLRTSAPITVDSPDGILMFSWAVDGLGDVNGDGYGDVIASALDASGGYIYFGGSDGLVASRAVALPMDSQSARGAGDVNGDGLADIVAGSSRSSEVMVILGSTSGPGVVEPQIIPGSAYSTYQFEIFSGPGDFNGDGYSDVVGGDVLFLGGPSVPGLRAAANVSTGDTLRNDDNMYAPGLSFAGDVDVDGYDDVAAGVLGSRAALFFLGTATFPPIQPGDTLPRLTPAFTFTRIDLHNYGTGVAGLGDVNGDSVPDLGIEAPSPYIGTMGTLQVLYGSASSPLTLTTTISLLPGGHGGIASRWRAFARPTT